MESRYKCVAVRRAAVLLAVASLIAGAGGTAASQAVAAGSCDGNAHLSGQNLYIQAPIEMLKKQIPDLIGLNLASSPDRLSSILTNMADTVAGVMPRLPNLVSHEEVYRAETAVGPSAPRRMIGVSSAGSSIAAVLPAQGPRGREFRYLIVCRRTPEGAVSLEESRTDIDGNPIDFKKKGEVHLGSGFAYQWLLFAAANQSEFHFRYLGEQQIDDRKTFVVAFAQMPQCVKVPAIFQSNGKQAHYFYQGILWIDQATSNIVLLRSDLEAPVKSVSLKQLTTRLRFRSVSIHDYDGSFWLPTEVQIQIDQETVLVEEEHKYSDYHLYHSTARIIP